ncbi:endospore germination permease (plasmid) [Priestia megaterium]|uniref:GerAB/ArcD/ProY family transporter n=1 Tax=Priestia megaterium TaxID=1404 RepID=UPI001EDAF313|nr:endospore germination permease [Priestia megaterium]UKJ83795.1 endospore germination permease [Priestia megaterium]
MNQKVIQSVHIYILLIMSTGFMVHVLVIPTILSTSNRDAWLSVIFSTAPFLLWIMLVFYIYKKLINQKDILLVLKEKLSQSWFFIIFSIVFGLYFLISAFITLKYTFFWANANYTFEIPNFVIILSFTLICLYASSKGIRTISTIALLMLPFVVFFGFLVGIGNSPNKNYELLFPIFEKGYKEVIQGLVHTCAGLFEIIFVLFLTSFLKDKLKFKWLLLSGMILVLLTLGPLVGVLSEFGPEEAAKFRNPAYEQWKLLEISQHITRLDFLSIFQWFSGAFVRISLALFITNKIFLFKKKTNWVLPILYGILIIGLLIPWDATSFFYFLKNFYFPISLILQICTVIFLLLIIHLKGGHHEESSN